MHELKSTTAKQTETNIQADRCKGMCCKMQLLPCVAG